MERAVSHQLSVNKFWTKHESIFLKIKWRKPEAACANENTTTLSFLRADG
jgi:hypothetical protein